MDTAENSVRETGSQAAVMEAKGARGPSEAPRSFKLRFAAEREPGRSNLSAIRPLALPAPVTDKWYTRWGRDHEEDVGEVLRRVQERFALGPRDRYAHPITTAQEYGWWWDAPLAVSGAEVRSAVVHHHLRDSAWLRARLRLLAPHAAFKRR